MTHPFEIRNEITVDATPDQVWEAIASGPGVDSWLMGHWEIDGASKTITFTMFGEVSSGTITVWDPGHRYAWQEDENPDGTFTAREWLIEGRGGGATVLRGEEARRLPRALRTTHLDGLAVHAGVSQQGPVGSHDRGGGRQRERV